MSLFDRNIEVELEKRIGSNGKSARAIVEEIARQFGVSISTVYRHLKKRRIYNAGKRSPSTRGKIRCGITREELLLIHKRKCGGIRIAKSGRATIRVDAQTVKNQCSTRQAIEELYAAGLIKGLYAEGTVNRHLRRLGVSLRQQRAAQPHTDMLSEYPNHVWQYDTTWCAQVYLPDGNFYLVDTEREFYRNKLKLPKGGKKLIRFVMVDHYSSCFFVRYYPSESSLCFQDFFWRACAQKDDPRLPLHGVPEILVTDQASEVGDAISRKILERLGVRHLPHFPENSRAKGTVEATMAAWEKWFESRLQFQPATSLDEINRWSENRCAEINARQPLHRPGGVQPPRSVIFNSYLQRDKVREIPAYDVYQKLAHKEKLCLVYRNGVIKFHGRQYRVGTRYAGEKVEVQWSAYDYPDVLVRITDEPLIKLSPIAFDEVGRRIDRAAVIGKEYKSPKENATMTTMKAAARVALKNFKPFDQADASGVRFLQQKGTPIEAETEQRYLRKEDVEIAIHAALDRQFTDNERAAIDALPDHLPEDQLDEIIQTFKAAHRARILGMASA